MTDAPTMIHGYKALAHYIPLSMLAIQRQMKAGIFPQCFRLCNPTGGVSWDMQEVQDYIEARKAER